MQVLKGKAIMEQIVAGRLCFYRRPTPQVQLYTQGDWRQELNRFHRAQQNAKRQLTICEREIAKAEERIAAGAHQGQNGARIKDSANLSAAPDKAAQNAPKPPKKAEKEEA